MTIVVTGGGSGGHITPILAVAAELKKMQPDIKIIYIGQRDDSLSDVPAADPNIDETYSVWAGKFRRYHSEGLRQILDIKTGLLNFRDAFRVIRGYFGSRRLLRRLKPDVIFIKGGFVGVPVGLAAGHMHIPYVTHDSDAIPGLANRLIAKHAAIHAVALPKEIYNYPAAKTVTVGVPVTDKYKLVTPALKAQYRQDIALPASAKLLFIIGGGLGAQRVNEAVVAAVPELLRQFPELHIVHGVGRANEMIMHAQYAKKISETERGRVHIEGFLNNVYQYSGAADVIITRAGATNLAEFAVQGKACIIIPNPYLTAGHQLKNAEYLKNHEATELVSESDLKPGSKVLSEKVSALLIDPERQALLGRNFSQFGHIDAAQKLAMVLLEQIKR